MIQLTGITVIKQYHKLSQCIFRILILLLYMNTSSAWADSNTLQSVDFTTLPGDSLQIQLTLSGPANPPKVFHTDNPARIALDLAGVLNGMDKKPIAVNVGNAESIQAISAGDSW